MSKIEITNKDLHEKLEEISELIRTQLTLFKLLNAEAIEDARGKILKLNVRRKIFDLCDNNRTVTQIAQELFPSEPTKKSLPKISYHLGILEEYGLVGYHDEKGERYYLKVRG